MNMLARIPAQGGLTTLHDRVNRLFTDFFGEGGAPTGTWVPPVDVVDTPEALLVRVELPGIDPEKVDTTISGEYLEIRGEKPMPEKIEDAKWYRFERATGAFHRRIRLPFPIDADKVEAQAQHGVLAIRLPKPAEVLPRRIDVKVAK